MRHISFASDAAQEHYSVAMLIKGSAFNKYDLGRNYVKPLSEQGIDTNEVIAFTLAYEGNKAPVKLIKEYLDELLPLLKDLKTSLIYVADANYFKVLTKQSKAEIHHGYVLPCKIKGYEHMHVVLGINYQAMIYNPELQQKLDLSLDTLANQAKGTYEALGTGIIHSAQYPEGTQAIREALQSLHQYPSLGADIEAFSLQFNEAGIGTISFAWDEHNGIAFAVDYRPYPEPVQGLYGEYLHNAPVKKLLKEFFEQYQGEITWHNGVYDIKVIIYELWMKSL